MRTKKPARKNNNKKDQFVLWFSELGIGDIEYAGGKCFVIDDDLTELKTYIESLTTT